MYPSKLTDATRSLGKPVDWDGTHTECETLDIFDYDTDNGHFMLSAWTLEPEELERLNNGGYVYLHIRGRSHPVVSLTVN
jgi:hypothetical protein